MVAWKTCTRPKDIGGLGISDLKLVTTAFEAKWLWLQKTDRDRAWAELPLKLTDEARAFFRASTYTIVGNGEHTLFWLDSWISGVSIRAMAPTLLKFVPNRIVSKQTVAKALTNRCWVRQITGGISVPAMAKYLHVWYAIREVVLTDTPDRLIWRWATDGSFSVQLAYQALHLGSHPIPGCVRIWETWAPLRVKLFLWSAVRKRHWTVDRRRRHGLDTHDNCLLCDQEPETIDHIVVECSYFRQIWFGAAMALGEQTHRPPTGSILEWWHAWRSQWTRSCRKGSDSLLR